MKNHHFQPDPDCKTYCLCGLHRDNHKHDHMPEYEELLDRLAACRRVLDREIERRVKAEEWAKQVEALDAARLTSIIATVGGFDYEGNPTSEVNYLQRLRILIEKEKRLQSIESEF